MSARAAIAGALLVLGAYALAALVAGGRDPGLAGLLACHAAIAGATGAAVIVSGRAHQPGLALLVVGTAAVGPLGAVGVLVTTALTTYFASKATSVEAWHAMLFPPTEVDPRAALWRRIGQRASDRPADAQVTPFLDILSVGSIPQRQAVIALIAQQFRPAFAPALRLALRDEHNVVRVQAATAIARLENGFLERTLRLERQARDRPDDDAVRLELAGHYDDYAFTGLLDPSRELDCRAKATASYRAYLDRHPEDVGVRFRLARLELRRGELEAAERLLRALVTERSAPDASLWLMECLFRQGRYGAVRAIASESPPADHEAQPPEVASAIALWQGREEAA
jgi:thioredoxin-like negative regulator of GroEL